MAKSASNDISDLRFDLSTTPTTLPIRGEKRIIPVPLDPDFVSALFNEGYKESGLESPEKKGYADTGRTQLVEDTDFLIKAALSPYVDYMSIRIPNRGVNAHGQQDKSLPAIFHFLVNPQQVSISRTTLDGQAMSRAGWQIGVWGEDCIQINISGKTAGQYFAFGLTDAYQQFTESYRNLVQLQTVFENNGYWFEGEQVNEGPLAADFTRRRIKMHQDVQLTCGNFIWSGMFDTFQIQASADEPFLVSFSLTFVAWKERFRSGSPYPDEIHNDVQLGHSYSAYAATQSATLSSNPTIQLPSSMVQTSAISQPNVGTGVNSSAIAAASSEINLPNVDPATLDYTPMQAVLFSNSQQNTDFWNGVK